MSEAETAPTPTGFAAAGHQAVLLDEVLTYLAPHAGGRYCDATVGLGGHAEAILERAAPDGRLIGLDRDPAALDAARGRLARFGDRVTLVHTPFSRARAALAALGGGPADGAAGASSGGLDGMLLDLGVSSPQLDRPERGFSFRRSGPLDMRMDPTTGETAAELLRRVNEPELEAILRDLGEERYAGRIARAIVAARDTGGEGLDTTTGLAAVVARSVPSRERHKDPATRTFQALRIAVNRELEELDRFLDDAAACLSPGGRLVIIAFHSLEDRIAKRRLRAMADRGVGGRPSERPLFRILTKHVVVPGEAELARNPRARSARLRAAERLAA